MIVSREDFENDPSYYINILGDGVIIIEENGEHIAKLTGLKLKTTIVDSLKGLIPPQDITEQERAERLKRNERDF